MYKLFSYFVFIICLLYQALSEEANPTTEADASEEGIDDSSLTTASDLLQQELDELKAESKNHTSSAKTVKMLTVRTNCKGVVMLRIGSRVTLLNQFFFLFRCCLLCVFIQIEENATEPSVDVQSMVDKLYESITETGSCCRLLVHVMPLQYTCFAGAEEIEAQLKPLIKEHFKDDSPCSYMVALKRRNNHTVETLASLTHCLTLTSSPPPVRQGCYGEHYR